MEFCSLATARFEFLRSLTAKDAKGAKFAKNLHPNRLRRSGKRLSETYVEIRGFESGPTFAKIGQTWETQVKQYFASSQMRRDVRMIQISSAPRL